MYVLLLSLPPFPHPTPLGHHRAPGWAPCIRWQLSTISHVVACICPEKAMAPHSSTLAWKIPWTEEPGELQPMGSRRVGHHWTTLLLLFTFMDWRRKWWPTPVSCLENPRNGRASWAAIYGVAQSRTWLKRLSSSSTVYMSRLLA